MLTKWRILLNLLFLTFAVLIPYASAQEVSIVSKGLAVALVIDSSASMKDNDPETVRIEAAKRAIDLLSNSDQICIIQFADEAAVLLPLRKVGGESSRNEILSTINNIGNKGYTDLKGGLEKALIELSKAETGKKKIVLLLSDGEPDLPYLLQNSKSMAKYMAELDKDIDLFKNQRLSVHCIALGITETPSLLRNIAQKTGGEYFLVTDPNELVYFFKSILITNKYPAIDQPSFFYDYKLNNYSVGDRFPVRAGFKIGTDNLVPGPHLNLEHFILKIILPDKRTITVPFKDDGGSSSLDQKKDDGVFSACVDCTQTGESTLYIQVKGTYKGKAIAENRKLGKITVEPELQKGKFGAFKSVAAMITNNLLNRLDQRKISENILLLAAKYKDGIIIKQYAISWHKLLIALILIIIISIAAFTIRYIRVKIHAYQIKGTLNYKIPTESSSGILNLEQLGKKEVLIATENDLGADFVLPKKNRNFAFKLIKINRSKKNKIAIKEFNLNGAKFCYLVICLPGTYLLYNKRPKSRQQIVHGDYFTIGDYVFELNCPEASEHYEH
ncbi:MAG: Uncharacterized protein XD78_0948 [Desulfotomaculum sp. 46_296]|nr:MAG: Uncharacterized protein XD78_0948 [Desulfotomaculum sp. 46_296]HAU32104.1 hypothetical protein [Desulfotomaculum sp.]